ncbi:MAG: hypothetical protein ACF8XB_02680 [Planctomycetota bacterium JB042]
MTTPPSLPPRDVTRSLRLALVEGAFFALMVGFAETYFVAAAVSHGASAFAIGMLVGLPLALGGVAAAMSVRRLQRLPRRRGPIVLLVAAQATVLMLLAVAEWTGRSGAGAVVVAACVHHVLGQVSGVLWSSWYGDLVPEEERGRYFARRARLVHTVTFAAVVAGGLSLDAVASSGAAGFAVLFAVAAVVRAVSASLLLASPEPEPGHRSIDASSAPLPPPARRLLALSGLLAFTVYLASPFFTPYMLTALAFDYRWFMAASAIQVAAKVVALRAWGPAVDARGPEAVYRVAALLVALIPLPWLFVEGHVGVLAVQTFSGVAWAAHEIGLLGLLLGQAPPHTRARMFARHSLVNGSSQLAGAAVGAAVFSLASDGWTAIFAASLVLRAAVALAAPWLLPPPTAAPRGRLALRMVGFRPSGGVSHRPIEEAEEGGGTARGA